MRKKKTPAVPGDFRKQRYTILANGCTAFGKISRLFQDQNPRRQRLGSSWAYLLVGGEHPIWEEAIESLVNPRQPEMEQMIEPRFTPAPTDPFEALLNQPFTGTFH